MRKFYLLVTMIITVISCGGASVNGVTTTDSSDETAETDTGNDGTTDDGEAFGYDDDSGTGSESIIVSEPSQLRSLVVESNPSGILPNGDFNEIQLPEFEYNPDTSSLNSKFLTNDNSNAHIEYSVEGLPEWLTFDNSDRIIHLAEGHSTVPKGQARGNIRIKYKGSITDDTGEVVEENWVNLVLNDYDDDEICDNKEVEYSSPPVINIQNGYIWSGDDQFESFVGIDIGNADSSGFDFQDNSDIELDFDEDSISNGDEVFSGTNPFIYTGSGDFELSSSAYHITILSGSGYGYSPDTFATGDFDNDGDLDVIAGGLTGGVYSIHVWKNNGDGTFNTIPVLSSIQGSAFTFVYGLVADVNHDQNLDYLVFIERNNLGIYKTFLGDGMGSFSEVSEGQTLDRIRSGTVGDFNGDGWMDFAVTYSTYCKVTVGINDQDGTFTLSDYTTCANAYNHFAGYNEAIVAGDINGDRFIDIVVGVIPQSGGYQVSRLLNDGEGTFIDYQTYPETKIWHAFGLFDVDHDGDLDGIGGESNLSISVNDGDGNFAYEPIPMNFIEWDGNPRLDENGDPVIVDAGNYYPLSANAYGKMVIFDANGDGYPDTATAAFYANKVDVAIGGDPSDGNVFVRTDAYSITNFVPDNIAGDGFRPRSMACGDVDGDGDIDLLVVSGNGQGWTVIFNKSNED